MHDLPASRNRAGDDVRAEIPGAFSPPSPNIPGDRATIELVVLPRPNPDEKSRARRLRYLLKRNFGRLKRVLARPAGLIARSRQILAPVRSHIAPRARLVHVTVPVDPATIRGIVVRLPRPDAHLIPNGMFQSAAYRAENGTAFVPAAVLEPWENSLLIQLAYATAGRMTVTVQLAEIATHPGIIVPTVRLAPNAQHNFTFRSTVASHSPTDGSGHRAIRLEPAPGDDIRCTIDGADPLELAYHYLFSSINRVPSSRYLGLAYPLYDLDHRTYRLAHWSWTSGVVIEALLRRFVQSGDADQGLKQAIAAADAALRFQIDDPRDPNDGALRVRCDPNPDAPTGYERWLVPNDAAFLAGYGLIPVGRATGDSRYWLAAERVGRWIVGHGMDPSGRLYVGYREDLGMWDKDWLYVDAGFTSRLFLELHRETGGDVWLRAGVTFIDDYISRLRLPGGLFARTWFADRPVRKTLFARGQAWALDGLLSSYELSGRGHYLDVALELAGGLVKYQRRNGAWHFLLDVDSDDCEKATPALAFQLLRLYRLTRFASLRDAAARAVAWCERHQYRGPDPNALGGITSRSGEGCIVYFTESQTTTSFGTAYYVLAKGDLRELQN